MARKSKFGGKDYAPQSAGPQPAEVRVEAPAKAPAKSPVTKAPAKENRKSGPTAESSTRGVMVQFTSRCELDAERQFKAMARELGKKQQALLAEALNFLFKKYGKPEVA